MILKFLAYHFPLWTNDPCSHVSRIGCKLFDRFEDPFSSVGKQLVWFERIGFRANPPISSGGFGVSGYIILKQFHFPPPGNQRSRGLPISGNAVQPIGTGGRPGRSSRIVVSVQASNRISFTGSTSGSGANAASRFGFGNSPKARGLASKRPSSRFGNCCKRSLVRWRLSS